MTTRTVSAKVAAMADAVAHLEVRAPVGGEAEENPLLLLARARRAIEETGLKTREFSIAVTKIDEAILWLHMASGSIPR